jgi:hypothetical protein
MRFRHSGKLPLSPFRKQGVGLVLFPQTAPCLQRMALVLAGIHQPVGLNPRHHAAQFVAHLLDSDARG